MRLGDSCQFKIGVCRQGSQTLTLFKGRKLKLDTFLKAQNQEMAPYLSYKRLFKITMLNFITYIRACSTVLTDHIFFVLHFKVDTAI